MDDPTPLGLDQFPEEARIGFIWPADKSEAPLRLNVDGRIFCIDQNTPYLAAAPIFEVVANSGYRIRRIETATAAIDLPAIVPSEQDSPPTNPVDDGDGADGSAGGGQPVGTTSFDADAVIVGTVEEVAARLAVLTPDQLEAVRKAEADREAPRKGVIKAIDEIAAKAADPAA